METPSVFVALVGASRRRSLVMAAPLGADPARNTGRQPRPELAAPRTARDRRFPCVVKPVGWTTTGNLSAWAYAPREATGRRRRSRRRSAGGRTSSPVGLATTPLKQTTHTASQTIDVAGAATEIDAGQVGATLTAFIGGYTVAKDLATVTARFLNAAGAQIGSVRVGPVSIEERKRLTVLLKRTAQANLPPKTRSIAVVITVTADRQRRPPRLRRQHLADARKAIEATRRLTLVDPAIRQALAPQSSPLGQGA